MPRVPMPSPDQVPPGPRRALLQAIHQLHEEAGWPGLQKTSAAIRDRDDLPDSISHEGISKILRGETVPAQWLKLESLVRQYLTWNFVRRGDIDTEVLRIQELWKEAVSSSPSLELTIPRGPDDWPSPERLAWLVNELAAQNRGEEADELFQRALQRGPEETVQVLAALVPIDPESVTTTLYFIGGHACQDYDRVAEFLAALHRIPPETWLGGDPVAALMKGVLMNGASWSDTADLLQFLHDRGDAAGIRGLMRAAARKLDPGTAVDLLADMKKLTRLDEAIEEFLAVLVANMDHVLVNRMVGQMRRGRGLSREASTLARLLKKSPQRK